MNSFLSTWTCHVCHRERPDAQISVVTTELVSDRGVRFSQNVRYCNDDPNCITEAPKVRFLKMA